MGTAISLERFDDEGEGLIDDYRRYGFRLNIAEKTNLIWTCVRRL